MSDDARMDVEADISEAADIVWRVLTLHLDDLPGWLVERVEQPMKAAHDLLSTTAMALAHDEPFDGEDQGGETP